MSIKDYTTAILNLRVDSTESVPVTIEFLSDSPLHIVVYIIKN